MKSLGAILREIAARRDEGMTDAEVERRTAAYYASAGIRCQTCFDHGTVGVKIAGPEPETDTYYGKGEPAKRGMVWSQTTCPDCDGRKGVTTEEVAYRRALRAGLPARHATFDSWDMTLNPDLNGHFRQVRAWAERPYGGLVLTGGTGRGKTHLLESATALLAANGVQTMYWRVPDLLTWFQMGIHANEGEMGYAERIDAVRNVTVLAIDDFGIGSVSETGAGTIEEIVDSRYWNDDKPWLFATNTGPSAWGPRLTSRFKDRSRVSVLAFRGEDVRPALQPMSATSIRQEQRTEVQR